VAGFFEGVLEAFAIQKVRVPTFENFSCPDIFHAGQSVQKTCMERGVLNN